MSERITIRLTVNGVAHTAEVEPRLHLADFLRDHLRLTGTHIGCEHGVCGACTILFDGATARACLMFAVQADGHDITTIEGDPMIVNKHMILPTSGRPHSLMDGEYFASLGMTITGMPALNAMRAVCEARPGMLTSADLPLRAFAGRFRATAPATDG